MSPDFNLKKVGIIFLAAISATLLTELAVRYILGFPTYGVEKKLLGIKSSEPKSNIFYPHSKYYNVEDGYQVYKRNNLGFYGKDVSWNKSDTLIYVLGSSYLEAASTPPDSMAVSHFQKWIDASGKPYKVINLGRSGHDPYDLYFRLAWFEKLYGKGKVILVLEGSYEEWLTRHPHPLSFSLSPQFGLLASSITTQLAIIVLNHSACAYMIKQAVKSADSGENAFLLKQTSNDSVSRIPNDLMICLDSYQKKYGDDFIVLSIMESKIHNDELGQYCSSKKINFYSWPINKAANKIKGIGHLNLYGNRQLGMALYECL